MRFSTGNAAAADTATSATKTLEIRTIMDTIGSCRTFKEDYVDAGKK
jgi:hypothetical protein